jgi:hypothetical protein
MAPRRHAKPPTLESVLSLTFTQCSNVINNVPHESLAPGVLDAIVERYNELKVPTLVPSSSPALSYADEQDYGMEQLPERSATPLPLPSQPPSEADRLFQLFINKLSQIDGSNIDDHSINTAIIAIDFVKRISHDAAFLQIPVALNGAVSTFRNLLAGLIPHETPATRTPAPAVSPDTPVPRPPAKRTRVSEPTPPRLTAPSVQSAPAPKKAVAAPALEAQPSPKDAPAVSIAAKPKPKPRQGKHTTHGAKRRGIILTPLVRDNLTSEAIPLALFTMDAASTINRRLERDLKSTLRVLHFERYETSKVFATTNRTPTTAECAFILKHIRDLSEPRANFSMEEPTSTSYVKVIDVPITFPANPKLWLAATSNAFVKALPTSAVGLKVLRTLKHKVCIMRTSAKSDSCVAWLNLHDTTMGNTAHSLINQKLPIGGANCQIRGARPHSGSVLCTRCMRWGHHSLQCRRHSRPHSEVNHTSSVDISHVDKHHCVNCTASKREKRTHSALDRALCPFWKHCFDQAWLHRQFPRLRGAVT